MAAENIVQFPGNSTTETLHEVKPGMYMAIYMRHEGANVFKGNKLKVLFRLMEHLDVILPRWYHVTGYKGRISAPAHSALVREVQAVLGTRVRHDRIPMASLANIVVEVEVSTVTMDSSQQPLAPVNQYQVIKRVRGRA